MAVPNWLSEATEPGGAGSQCVHCSEVFTDPLTYQSHEQLCSRCVQCNVKLEPLEQWQRGNKKPLCKPCFDKIISPK